MYTIASPADIVLHKDGEVHQNTFALKKPARKMIKSENVAVADIGVAIYDSLDFGVAEDEQRTLSEEVEQVIDRMVSADEDAEDEGLGEECDAARSVLVGIGLSNLTWLLIEHHDVSDMTRVALARTLQSRDGLTDEQVRFFHRCIKIGEECGYVPNVFFYRLFKL